MNAQGESGEIRRVSVLKVQTANVSRLSCRMHVTMYIDVALCF